VLLLLFALKMEGDEVVGRQAATQNGAADLRAETSRPALRSCAEEGYNFECKRFPRCCLSNQTGETDKAFERVTTLYLSGLPIWTY
jgi:hypothetical protein